MKNNSKIVIVGAGASGVSAAAKLIENGFENVLILETNDRIGGRIHSVPFGSSGALIDMGAQWVSGENDIYRMMKDHFKFGETGINGTNQAFVRAIGEAQADRSKCIRLQALGEEIFSSSDEMNKSDETYGEFFKRKYAESLKTPEFQDIEQELSNQILHQHQNEFNAIFASPNWDVVPAKFVPDSVFIEGSQSITWRKSGYKILFDFIIVRFLI